MDPQTQNDIAKLSDADRKELTQFLENEAQRSNIQQSK
jgi:import inner membrane translocase subunit TIM8